MKHNSPLVISTLATIAAFAAEPQTRNWIPFAQDPVPSFASIPTDELFPKGAKIEVAQDGSLLVNGKPR